MPDLRAVAARVTEGLCLAPLTAKEGRRGGEGEDVNLIKLLCSPIVLAVSVAEDAVLLIPSKMTDPNHESATSRAVKMLAEDK